MKNIKLKNNKLKTNRAFSLIEVLITSIIVLFALMALTNLSLSFSASQDKLEANSLAKMISYSITNAMRINTLEFRRNNTTYNLEEFNNQNQNDCINGVNCTSGNLLLESQLKLIYDELLLHFDCQKSGNNSATFCLDLQNSQIEHIADCKIEGISLNEKPQKYQLSLQIKRITNQSLIDNFKLIFCI